MLLPGVCPCPRPDGRPGRGYCWELIFTTSHVLPEKVQHKKVQHKKGIMQRAIEKINAFTSNKEHITLAAEQYWILCNAHTTWSTKNPVNSFSMGQLFQTFTLHAFLYLPKSSNKAQNKPTEGIFYKYQVAMLLAIVSSHSNMFTRVMTRINTCNLTTNYKVNSFNALLFLVAADCNINGCQGTRTSASSFCS